MRIYPEYDVEKLEILYCEALFALRTAVEELCGPGAPEEMMRAKMQELWRIAQPRAGHQMARALTAQLSKVEGKPN